MNKASPCVDICVFESATGWCIACGRTLPEARQWSKLKPFKRNSILSDLPRRLKKLQEQGKAWQEP